MLEDLNKFRKQAIDSFNRNYDPEDRCLPMEFKRLCTKFNINDTIEYKEYSMIIHGASSLNIYVPNQWVYIAAFFADYYLLLVKYKETIKSILNGYLDDRVKNCKDSEANATRLLATYNGPDKDYLIKFLYDYNWWGGAKTIDRADFYVSPILSAANLVNVSQSYVADLAKNLAENPQALQLLKKDIAKISIQNTTNFKSASNTILYGPPGTGKTYEMQKIFAGYPEGNRSVITFHQSYSYEEFIIGLKAKTTKDGKIEYSYEPGVFYKACEQAAVLAGYSSLAECCSDTKESRNAKFAAIARDTSRQFLFCIDEINRANISAVFGDLISLIEENKRLGAQNEMIVRLPYTQELFGVPANLRLLGTMNTADRSIQILDTALRRRFQFKEYLPKYSVLRNEKAKNILHAINDRIRALLGQDRQIGHSYFYDIEASAADESIRILKALTNKIIPLLQEYFYNDVEKIRFVLGEKDRIPDEHSFYIEDGDATAAFSRYDSDSEETQFYTLNTDSIASASMSNESASAFLDHISA